MATFGTFVSGQVLTAAELNGAGAYQAYTPTWTQSATITKTVNWARFTQLNKLVIGSVRMTATSAGTANNKVLVSLPVDASTNNFIMGTAYIVDESTTPDGYAAPLSVLYESASTVSFQGGASAYTVDVSLRLGQTNSQANITIASGDIIYMQFMYEAA